MAGDGVGRLTVLGQGEIRDLLERHGLEARRSLGQNFVADPGTVERIARRDPAQYQWTYKRWRWRPVGGNEPNPYERTGT